MEKPLDKINQAFNGTMGAGIETKTRSRIYWIMSNVCGNKVLDIGCSQGITSILLGREGKEVIGVDALSESINIAKLELEKEEASTQKNVEFLNDDILSKESVLLGRKFDTVILGEILEHFADGDSLLKRASMLGHDETTYIITVPFGINDYFDHKKTYYYAELAKEVKRYFEIKEVSYMGKWIGIILKKMDSNTKDINFTYKEIQALEENFYKVERDLLNRNKRVVDINKKNQECIKELEAKIMCLENQVIKNQDIRYKEITNTINQSDEINREFINKIDFEVAVMKEAFNDCLVKLQGVKNETKDIGKELNNRHKEDYEMIKKENEMLKGQLAKLKDINNVQMEEQKIVVEQLKKIEKKYNRLSNSKLGKLTLKYWRMRNNKK